MSSRLWPSTLVTLLCVFLLPRFAAAQPLGAAVAPDSPADFPPGSSGPVGEPPHSPHDLKLLMFGFRIQLGGAIPTGVAAGANQTVNSSAYGGVEFTMDIGPWVHLGAGLKASSNVNSHGYAPTYISPNGGSVDTSSNGPGIFQLRAHVYPVPLRVLGFFRPYLGLGFGYSSAGVSTTQNNVCTDDFLFGRQCSSVTTSLASYSGSDVELTVGLRYDVRILRSHPGREHFRAAWLIPFYVEASYLKNFWSKPAGSQDGRFDLIAISGGVGMMF